METKVKAHYNSKDLTQKLVEALEKIKPGTDEWTLKDLAPIDQLHTGGAKATIDLLQKAGIETGSVVLDAGCGIGGSSRLMANEFGLTVTGIDLSESFIQAAQTLSNRSAAKKHVDFQQGSIMEIPFDDAFFDAVLSQHVLMNIEDKKGVFEEFSRVLRPGGKLVLHEIAKGDDTPVVYPVPWASKQGISFLTPWPDTKRMIKNAGFDIILEIDGSQSASRWWQKAKSFAEKNKEKPPVLGPHLVFGANAKLFPVNMAENFKMNRIKTFEMVAIKR